MKQYEDFVTDDLIPAVAACLSPEENARLVGAMRPLLAAIAENIAHGRRVIERLREPASMPVLVRRGR